MDFPDQHPDSRHLDYDRMTEIPGFGLVPKGPRSCGRLIDRRESQRPSQRHGSSREQSRRNSAQRALFPSPSPPVFPFKPMTRQTPPRRRRRYDNQNFKEETPENSPANEKHKNPVRADSELFVPEYHSPMQFLAESFDRRRCQLSHEVTRREALSGNASQQKVDHRERDRFYARDQPQYQRSDLSARRSSESIRIKREDSVDRQSDVPPDTDNTSKRTSPPSEPTESGSSGGGDGSRRRSSPPRGPTPPAPDAQGDDRPRCKCPVGRDCPRKGDDQVDCRTLVLEFERWIWDQIKQRAEQVPPDRDPEDESFVTPQETRTVIRLLDQIRVRNRMSMGIRHIFAKIQDWIRLMQNNSMTQEALDESRVFEHLKRFLSEENRPIREEKGVPEHIVEDLTILYRKWEFGDLGVLVRRGLRAHRPGGPLWPDPDWQWKRSADYFGHGHLVNGQTWLLRAEMMRDGAHAPYIAGISGSKTEGARSIVMGYHDDTRKEYYADIDEGETIYYYGTALPRAPGDTEPTNLKDAVTHRVERITKNSKGQGPTDATMALFVSYRTGRPVRVFRSWKLSKIVPHRPVTGFRYDGLYIVKAPELVKIDRQIYRFRMERMTTGQGPLRHSGETPLQPEGLRGSRKRRRDGQ
ncbi:uncharacterized protein Z520_01302 [Fonsecaea multimorphosa CBS 102226]|uniref:YDG domain-containing protein n=1 Tax=Fonsecaea multimorphosa CBS 102226 TaxID=1442371 RepID=A0A0D2J0F8_9EURO|nr:uncharacterized protein Z520_01302 [Fonsecaea multimorphosa CBS 102226]KIY02837.1 hypothetical protein Z520_01302 [Fonsecaea multimorphosa CBS 102226]